MSTDADLDTLTRTIKGTLGSAERWTPWPGGWKAEISTALIDAVYSARATYWTANSKGILANVRSWRERADSQPLRNSLRALAGDIASRSPARWAEEFGNSQTSPGRRSSDPGGATKAAAVLEASLVLVNADPLIDRAENVKDHNVAHVQRLVISVPGIGYATASYFAMLLGHPGVKPDRMIHGFLQRALGHRLSDASAAKLVTAAARHLDVDETKLDHAIWSYESKARQGGQGITQN